MTAFAVVALVMLVAGSPGTAASGMADDRAVAPARRAAPDRGARLVVRHHCWRGSAPEGAGIPGHAVVSLPGRRARLVRAAVGFGVWLDDRPGTLYAFCP